MKTLTITDDKVRAGAAECSDAARILKKMFPEAFVADSNDLRSRPGVANTVIAADGTTVLSPRASASHLHAGIGGMYVDHRYKAEIVTDNQGYDVIVFKRRS